MVFLPKKYLFCGVGGSGMSALAKVVVSQGHKVYGSDRNFDAGRFPDLYQKLIEAGITMVPQDGSGLSNGIDTLVVSSAVEPNIPDVKAALDKNIPVVKRAELLSQICNAKKSVCVGGTNGKSTVTGMIGWILNQAGEKPTIINGGGMLNFNRDNAVIGSSERIVVETDESDGTITNFRADIAVLTNIAEDHKDMAELIEIFRKFLKQSKMQVLNLDCPHVAQLAKEFPHAVTYNSDQEDVALSVPGLHNQSNAKAARAVAQLCHVNSESINMALASFKGIVSRLEVVGEAKGITVIDDFGHNPDKITAGLKTLKEMDRRLILMYQPHGYAPTRQHKDDLIRIFGQYLNKEDVFYMPDILYFGGTVEKNISSEDIIKPLQEKGLNANYIPDKYRIEKEILEGVKPGDVVCIMGARDDFLRAMAQNILQSL